MLIWRGRGILIVVIAFVCLVLTEAAINAGFHDGKYYSGHGWPKLAGFALSALIVWALSRSATEEYAGVAPSAPPKQPLLRRLDSLFFIPARFWPFILLGIGIVFTFARM